MPVDYETPMRPSSVVDSFFLKVLIEFRYTYMWLQGESVFIYLQRLGVQFTYVNVFIGVNVCSYVWWYEKKVSTVRPMVKFTCFSSNLIDETKLRFSPQKRRIVSTTRVLL